MRVAGLDVGTKTIGVAVSDPLGWTAQGVEVVRRQGLAVDLRRLGAIFAAYGVELVVVGLPRHMGGAEGEQAGESRRLGAKITAELGLPVVFWDERLTTAEAERTLVAADVSRRRRRQVVDMLAAQLILQGYLDRQARQTPEPGEH